METGVTQEKVFVWESCSLDNGYRCFQRMVEVVFWMMKKACRLTGGEYREDGQVPVGGVTLFKKKEHPVRILDSKSVSTLAQWNRIKRSSTNTALSAIGRGRTSPFASGQNATTSTVLADRSAEFTFSTDG